ncbi:hypothetical protein UFOVP27_16 [uncultured Caudovirales phage]|uniref:Uncharacterized protein n=1 Tax=uncultured Caudovirales phage TaxID=2100421 RepID=A0A6J5KP09_9CAUD|nr:hypothetical protein UFOVP27_16 [uncultured Caudovirales phage]
MSNLSAKYEPTVTPAPRAPFPENMAQNLAYLHGGLLPANLLDISTQTSAYRDATIAATYKEGYAPGVLLTFLRELQTIEHVDEKHKVTLCEYAATMAYLSGELELVKEILIRVPSQSVTSYIKTLYTALAIKGWNADAFKNAIDSSSSRAIEHWEQLKNQYI